MFGSLCKMNKGIRKTTTIVFFMSAVLFLCSFLTLEMTYASEEVDSGTCGDNLIWVLDDEGTLTISGEGELYGTPWKNDERIKKVIIESGVKGIGHSSFSGCGEMISISIPNSVTSIGTHAFSSCSSLTGIMIPDSITSIGAYAFSYCGLTSVTVPNGVTSIKTNTFSGCTSLASVTIPNSVTSIGTYAFSECKSLTSVTIPNSVTSIGTYAFTDCSSLTSITIPDNVTSINYAFFWCSSLTSVTIPEGVKSIEGAFSYCSSLTSITIPDSVTSIDGAFSGCGRLTSVKIPNGATNIGTGAFSGCSSLTSITIPDSVTSIGVSAFDGCSGLTNITLPDRLRQIEKAAFRGCVCLTSITIPNGVTNIGAIAFSDCEGLTSITIPKSVTSIEGGAFDNCYPDNIYFGGTKEQWEKLDNTPNGKVHFAETHIWDDEFTVDMEPTCTKEGSKSRHCSHCDEVIDITVIPAKGHAFDEAFTVDVEPNCTETGSKSRHCANCSEVTDVTVIPANGHNFGPWEEITASTCESSGAQRRICEVCGYTETQNLDPSAHQWEDELTVDVEPSCTKAGSRSRHCKNCDVVIDSETIPATGHKQGLPEIFNDPETNASSGYQAIFCSNCRELLDLIPKNVNEEEFTPEKKAAFQKAKSTFIKCYNEEIGKDDPDKALISAVLKALDDAAGITSEDTDDKKDVLIWFRNDANKTVTYNGNPVELKRTVVTIQQPTTGKLTFTYYSDPDCTKAMAATPKNAGTYYVLATVASDNTYKAATTTTPAEIVINKAAVKVTPTSKTYKIKNAKKLQKNMTFNMTTKGLGKKISVTYKKTSGNKNITVSKAGKVTVKKGLKKNTYKIKVRITPKSKNFAGKTVTVKIIIKK